MPTFAGTIANNYFPTDAFVSNVIIRIDTALNFMHCKNWMHGDVKPMNIFVDYSGACWLGDYGSSVEYSDISSNFMGGTLAFQCKEYLFLFLFSSLRVNYVSSPKNFDKMGLVISCLSILKLIDDNNDMYPANVIENAIALIPEDFSCKKMLCSLFLECFSDRTTSNTN